MTREELHEIRNEIGKLSKTISDQTGIHLLIFFKEKGSKEDEIQVSGYFTKKDLIHLLNGTIAYTRKVVKKSLIEEGKLN